MRFYTFNAEGRQHLGVEKSTAGELIHLHAIEPAIPDSLLELIRRGAEVYGLARQVLASNPPSAYRLAEVTLAAPIPRPGKILCTGINYQSHQKENPNAIIRTRCVEPRPYRLRTQRRGRSSRYRSGAETAPTKIGWDSWSEIACVTLRAFPPISRIELVIRKTKFFVHFIGPQIGELSHKGDRHAQDRVLERPVECRGIPHQSIHFFSNEIHPVNVRFHRQRDKICRIQEVLMRVRLDCLSHFGGEF
jgi:hypothetical protein